MHQCLCKNILEDYFPYDLGCCYSCLNYSLGNAMATSSEIERTNAINTFRHILHNTWAKCVCQDNNWEYTSDVIIAGSKYTPDRMIKDNKKTMIYDYTVTANVERSYMSKLAKYKDLCDLFMLVPYIINGNTEQYLASMNISFGKNCKSFENYILSIMPFSNFWVVATDEYDDEFPNIWHPNFKSRNSMVRVKYPDISDSVKNSWLRTIGGLDKNCKYLLRTNNDRTRLISTLSDAGKSPSEWMTMFESNWQDFLFHVVSHLVIETIDDDNLIYNPIDYSIIHESIIANFNLYMSRSIIMTDCEYKSPLDVYKLIDTEDYPLLSDKINKPLDMLQSRYNHIKIAGVFNKKETFMIPVCSSVTSQSFRYHSKVLKFQKKDINYEKEKELLNQNFLNLVNRNNEIAEIRKKMSSDPELISEMYSILNHEQDYTPKTELGKNLGKLVEEQHKQKREQSKMERRVYKRNMFKAEADMRLEIERELNTHLQDLNVLNEAGGNYIENVITSIINYLCTKNDGNFMLYNLPVAEEYNSWWSKVSEWDKNGNSYIGELSNYNVAYLIKDIYEIVKTVVAMSDFKVESKNSILYDVPIHSRWCILVSCNSKGLSSGSSRPFSIITSVNGLNWYNYDTGRNDIKGNFVRYHWRYIKIDQLYFYSNLMEHVCSIYSTLRIEKIIANPCDDLFIKAVLVMLDGRRKTEIFLHDMKYLIFNLMGIHTDFNELIEDKFVQPTNVVLAYFELLLINNSGKYIDSVKDNKSSLTNTTTYNSNFLYHPLSNSPCNLDRFAFYNYLSYCSIKGVFTRSMEDNVNLAGIVKNHKEFLKLNLIDNSYESFRQAMNDPDNTGNMLYYDHTVMMAISEYILEWFRLNNKINLQSKWHDINLLPLSSIATSSGMRSQEGIESGDLIGNGHMKVMKVIKDRWKEITNFKIENDYKKDKSELLKRDLTLDGYSKNIYGNLKCYFTFANKKQWGGSREIYIQTIEMKSIQFRIEKMLSEMCKSLDNELIHIPSNKRCGYIYNYIKAPINGRRFYLTLDCKRWAPLCNMSKYIDLINSWSNYLPESFVNLFNFYMSKYYEKKLVIDQDQYNSLSSKDPETASYFSRDPTDTYSMTMPESFMMGMFNYLSSFVHASVQKYFIDNIIPLIARTLNLKISMIMFAHSDDSGGWIEISGSENENVIRNAVKKVLDLYQNVLRLTNHHLSTKKCVISEFYFEIISIIYICTDIMPVYAKNVYTFTPPAEKSGPINDLLTTSSAMYEMFANGSSVQSAYNKRMNLCHSILRSCNYTDQMMTKAVPVRLGGFPTSHPLFQLLFGSFAEEAFWYSVNKKMVNESLIVSGQGYNKRLCNYINPDPRYYSTIKKANKYFLGIEGESLIDITDQEKIKTCYQYMIKMKEIVNSGNLNKIFGSVFDTPLNFLKRMNLRNHQYEIHDQVVSLNKLPLIWSSITNSLQDCEGSEILDTISDLNLPKLEDFVQDMSRIKPIKIIIDDPDPIRWVKRLQVFKMWKSTNYLYYLSISDYPIDSLIDDIKPDISMFSMITMSEGINDLNYELVNRPFESREVNSVEQLVNTILNNEEHGMGVDRRFKINVGTVKDDVSALIRELIYNKVDERKSDEIVVNSRTLKDWLKSEKGTSDFGNLGNPILYRYGNQKRVVGTFDWLGKIQLYIYYQGQGATLEVKNGIVTCVTTNIKGQTIINLLKDWLPNSGYHFPIKLSYPRGSMSGYYMSRKGSFYYSEVNTGDPVVKDIFYKPNLMPINRPVTWVYGTVKEHNRLLSYEIMSKYFNHYTIKIQQRGKRLVYDPFGKSRLMSLPQSFNVKNMSNWYTSTTLYHSIYEHRDIDCRANPHALTLTFHTLSDKSFVNSYMANEVSMQDSENALEVAKAIKETIHTYPDGRCLKVKYESKETVKETRMISINNYKHKYYQLCGQPTMDRECLVASKGHILFDFLMDCSSNGLNLQEMYSQYLAIINHTINSNWYHPCSWPLLKEYCTTICRFTDHIAFKDPDVTYILIKNSMYIKEQLDVSTVRNNKRSWARNVYKVFKSIDPKMKDESLGYFYYPLDVQPVYGFLPSIKNLIDFLELSDTIEYTIDEYVEENDLDEEDDEVLELADTLFTKYCPDGNFIDQLPLMQSDLNVYTKGCRIDPSPNSDSYFLDKLSYVDYFGSILPYGKKSGQNLVNKLVNKLQEEDKQKNMEPLIAYMVSLYRIGKLNPKQINYTLRMIDKEESGEEIRSDDNLMRTLLQSKYDVNYFNCVLNTIKSNNPNSNLYKVVNSMYTFTTGEHDPKMLAELNAISPTFVKLWLSGSLCLSEDQIVTWKNLLSLASNRSLRSEIKDLILRMISECRVTEPNMLTSLTNKELNRILKANEIRPEEDEEFLAPQGLISDELYL